MESHFLLLQLSFATRATPPSLSLLNYNYQLATANNTGGPSGPHHWAWKNQGPTSTGRSKFNREDELYADSGDYDDEFGFSGTGKQRVWWFDDDDDDDDDWDVDYEENEFWVFKVIKAFGWMLPAFAISFLLGTDSANAFFMALAVPLGQTALSLVMDKVWGTTRSANPKRRSRTKTRKKPFARAAEKTKATERKTEEYKTNEEKGSYQPWMATDGGSNKKDANKATNFGGWDDLDRASYKATGRTQNRDELPKQDKGKLSRRGRVKDRPLLLRLLIAVFPSLASWTKFLF